MAAASALAFAPQADAMRGAVDGPVSEHASAAVLERNGMPVCTASLVGPGWALTAAHCVDEQPQALRMIDGTDRVLSLGRVYRSPDGGDLALIQVPEAAALSLPHLTMPAPLGAACRLEPRSVIAVGAGHTAQGTFTRTTANASLRIYEECDPTRFTPMLLAPEGVPISLCSGDSGMPIIQRSASGSTIEAVVVSQVSAPGKAGCGRDHFAIGFVEPLRSEARLAWLSRTATPPRAPRAFTAAASLAPGPRVRVRLAVWQASPPPGSRVTLVARGGRVWGTARVARSGAVTVRRPPPGTYRLRFTGAAGTRWSTPIRMG